MKKANLILNCGCLLLASLLTAKAQTTTTTYNNTSTSFERAASVLGPVAGEFELTLGGVGSSNKDLDNSSGGMNASLGYYINDTLEVVVRQSVDYINGAGGGGADFGYSTFAALDQHLWARGALRPFVGVNIGGFYGDNTNDTWAAGLEVGAKYYVKPKTFIFALVGYSWVFNSSDQLSDNFDDGAFQWNVGIGFNF